MVFLLVFWVLPVIHANISVPGCLVDHKWDGWSLVIQCAWFFPLGNDIFFNTCSPRLPQMEKKKEGSHRRHVIWTKPINDNLSICICCIGKNSVLDSNHQQGRQNFPSVQEEHCSRNLVPLSHDAPADCRGMREIAPAGPKFCSVLQSVQSCRVLGHCFNVLCIQW
jgi:hypothetical protein